MSEWWTYHLSDFLLFTPSTYYRLFEIYNAAIWPAQIAALALGLLVLALVRREGAARSRLVAAILAAGWLWVGIAFLAKRYATINWAAAYAAWAFGLEAALLLGMCLPSGGLRFGPAIDGAGWIGLGIFVFALVLEPGVGPLLGRSWKQAEIFGTAPDPTTVATLGLLLVARGKRRWPLLVVPVLWCGLTGATLLAMKARDFWIAPLAAAATIAAAIWQSRHVRRSVTLSR